jgi:hypothetical protein
VSTPFTAGQSSLWALPAGPRAASR